LSTLAVPDTWTGDVIVVLASGLSMMIFRLSGIGVAAVTGSVVLAGLALAWAEDVAPALALAVGDPLSTTKVVVLSPPHPANTRQARPRESAAPNPFMTPLNEQRPQPVTATGRLGAL
jgi:hypothetical protein